MMDQRDNPLNAMSPAERAELCLDDASNSESPLDRAAYGPGSKAHADWSLDQAVSQGVAEYHERYGLPPGSHQDLHKIPELAKARHAETDKREAAFLSFFGDMHARAMREGLWFVYDDLWLSPQEFKERFIASGEHCYRPGEWTLRDPMERVAEIRQKAEELIKKSVVLTGEIERSRKPAEVRQYVNTQKLSAHLGNLIDAVADHRNVVRDTHPGLMTWREMYHQTWKTVEDAISLVRAENGIEAPQGR